MNRNKTAEHDQLAQECPNVSFYVCGRKSANRTEERGIVMSRKILTILSAIVLFTSFAVPTFASEPDQKPATQGDPRFTRVLVSGDSIVQAQPDTAVLSIAVVHTGKTRAGCTTGECNEKRCGDTRVKDGSGRWS